MKQYRDQCDKCGLTCVWPMLGMGGIVRAFDLPERVPASALREPQFALMPAIPPHRATFRELDRVPVLLPGEVAVQPHSVSCQPRPHPPRRRHHPHAMVR